MRVNVGERWLQLHLPHGEGKCQTFLRTIHQVQTGPSCDLPKPLPGVHTQWDLEVGVDTRGLEVRLQSRAP